MPFPVALKKLIRRDATAQSLRDRAATLRGSLPSQTHRTKPSQEERSDYRTRLLAAFAEDRASRPVGSVGGFTLEHEAAGLAYKRCCDIAREIITLPPPSTADGLALTALAASILVECEHSDDDPATVAAVGLTRAVLNFTGTPLPRGFVGFGDEPDFAERDAASVSGEYALPVWAVEQAKAKRAHISPHATEPQSFSIGSATDAPTLSEQSAAFRIAGMIDLAAASMNELSAIHDTAKLVGDVAQAAVWQGRCKASTQTNPYAPDYNTAGKVMVWLSDELTHVEHLAIKEMKKRNPADLTDRERRLAWIAAPIIQNGDTTETAAFIGDLATWLADDRGG